MSTRIGASTRSRIGASIRSTNWVTIVFILYQFRYCSDTLLVHTNIACNNLSERTPCALIIHASWSLLKQTHQPEIPCILIEIVHHRPCQLFACEIGNHNESFDLNTFFTSIPPWLNDFIEPWITVRYVE